MRVGAETVSVVVATYSESRFRHLVETIRSLRRQTVPPLEVIVVVDHNPALSSRVRDCLPGVLTVDSTHPAGLAGARNAGLSAARGDVVAFIDDDAVAGDGWLETLLIPYEDPDVVGVGGAVEPAWERKRPEWFPPELDWVVGCTYRGLPRKPAPVRNLIGSNMSFRREAVLAVGGFRTGFGRVEEQPLGCEETELCIRLRQSRPGSSLVYLPEARVEHFVPLRRQGWSYLVRRCYSEGLSKAQVARAVGRSDGLSSEREYVLHTLPAAFGRGLWQAVSRLQPAGLKSSGAIATALLLTTVAYCRGRLSQRLSGTTRSPAPPELPGASGPVPHELAAAGVTSHLPSEGG